MITLAEWWQEQSGATRKRKKKRLTKQEREKIRKALASTRLLNGWTRAEMILYCRLYVEDHYG